MKSAENKESQKNKSFLHRAVLCLALIAMIATGFPPRPAQAFGGKTLTLLHMHSKESLTVTFSNGGRYDSQALDKLNWFLRDWRTNQPTKMDPRLFDLLYEVYRQTGSREPIRVVSAYRSPQTNSMLRRRSRAVAEHSQHMLGKAMDFYLSDVPSETTRAIAMKMQDGGVGYYPNSYSQFIHLDVGGVRAWPRMTRGQLQRLFPDGKTVHIPADGQPLPGYEEAKVTILARGGKVAGETAVADASDSRFGRRRSLWATLFGGDEDEEDDSPRAAPRRNLLASRNTQVASAGNDDDYGGRDTPSSFFQNEQRRRQQQEAPSPVRVATASAPVAAKEPPPQEVAEAEPVPLPPARAIATMTQTADGPQMVWQAGSSGQTASDSDPFSAAAGSRIAFTPQPPPRPEEIAAAGIMTYAPLPPSRPEMVAAAQSGKTTNVAAIEDVVTTASISSSAPLPPIRPASISERAIVVASLSATTTAAHAQQKRVPEAPAQAKAASHNQSVAAPAKATTPRASANLHANISPKALLKPNTINAAPSGFSQTAYGDLSTNRFSGPAVKPVANR